MNVFVARRLPSAKRFDPSRLAVMNFRTVTAERESFLGQQLLLKNANISRVESATGDVTAVVTAMTDGERPYLSECVNSVVSDPGIAHAIVCVQENNSWVEQVLGSDKKDPRIQILRLRMAPAGAVRNQALRHVKTEWVAYCDGDDVWRKGKTLLQRAYAEKTNADFVASDHFLTDEAGHVRAVALAKYLPMVSSWMVRARIMRKYPFKEEKGFNGLEDHEWWFRTAYAFSKSRCPRLLLRYRVRALSLSSGEPSKERKARAVALGSKPVIGLVFLFLTGCLWLVNRSKSYRPLLK
jgi:glycosyltransferase involved in cell wall biosynthesis